MTILVAELVETAKHLHSQPDCPYLQLVGLVIHTRKLIMEGSKANVLSERLASKYSEDLDALLEPKPTPRPLSPIPDLPQPLPLVDTGLFAGKREKRVLSDSMVANVESDMLRMASDMRDAALNVHSTLQKDRAQLSTTADAQDANLSATQRENRTAAAVRASKRLSFIKTVFMVIASLVIFLALIPVIVVT